jgi:hypothetical protein
MREPPAHGLSSVSVPAETGGRVKAIVCPMWPRENGALAQAVARPNSWRKGGCPVYLSPDLTCRAP